MISPIGNIIFDERNIVYLENEVAKGGTVDFLWLLQKIAGGTFTGELLLEKNRAYCGRIVDLLSTLYSWKEGRPEKLDDVAGRVMDLFLVNGLLVKCKIKEDAKIGCRDGTIAVSRSVLALFTTRFQEITEGDSLQFSSELVAQLFKHYLYTRKLLENSHKKSVRELLSYCEYLENPALKFACTTYLKKSQEVLFLKGLIRILLQGRSQEEKKACVRQNLKQILQVEAPHYSSWNIEEPLILDSNCWHHLFGENAATRNFRKQCVGLKVETEEDVQLLRNLAPTNSSVFANIKEISLGVVTPFDWVCAFFPSLEVIKIDLTTLGITDGIVNSEQGVMDLLGMINMPGKVKLQGVKELHLDPSSDAKELIATIPTGVVLIREL